ncbi:MAG: hypothetical protein ACK56F_10580, partial [bacterium]
VLTLGRFGPPLNISYSFSRILRASCVALSLSTAVSSSSMKVFSRITFLCFLITLACLAGRPYLN